GAVAFAQPRRGDGAGHRTARHQPRPESHGGPARHPDRGVRGRVEQHPIGGHMSPEPIFRIHLVLGYVAWLLSFFVYRRSRHTAMARDKPHGAIATLHSFRFFGLVFILPAVVGPNLPAGLATLAAYGDLATGVLAILALLTVRVRPLFWLFIVA